MHIRANLVSRDALYKSTFYLLTNLLSPQGSVETLLKCGGKFHDKFFAGNLLQESLALVALGESLKNKLSK